MRLTPEFIRKLLANEKLTATDDFDGALHGLSIALSTQPLPDTGDVVYADSVVEPTYDGYANQACAFGATHLNPNGDLSVDGPLLTFQEAGDLSTEVIQGMALYLPGTPKVVYGVENFPEPVVLATADDAVKVVPQVAFGISDGGQSTIVA